MKKGEWRKEVLFGAVLFSTIMILVRIVRVYVLGFEPNIWVTFALSFGLFVMFIFLYLTRNDE